MAKEICISSTPHETRLAILEDDQLAEIYYERENEYTLAGSIYNGRVTRVLPGMQSAFVDIGLERDAFLYVTDFLELEDQEETDEIERAAANPNQAPREVRSGGPNGQRHASSERAPRPAPEEAAGAEGPSTESHAAGDKEETGETQTDQGAKRWRGRRRRRGTRGGAAGSSAPAEGTAFEAGTAHASDEEEGEEVTPAREPASQPREAKPSAFVLPGEALSKYGGVPVDTEKKAVAEAPSRPAITSRPSTLIESPLAWDGSGLLPGESISRHRTRPTETETEPPSVEEAVGSFHAQVDEGLPQEDDLLEETLVHEGVIDSGAEPDAIPPATLEAAGAVLDEPTAQRSTHDAASETDQTAEEPSGEGHTDRSASHRVDPFPPSGFRLFGFGGKGKKEDEGSLAPPAHEPQFAEEEPVFAEPLPRSSFSPGNGVVEEELIEGEEGDAELHRQHKHDEHDLDEYEEETLQTQIRSGELGEMLQEAHLDHRIQMEFEAKGAVEEDDETLAVEEEEEEAEKNGTQAPAEGQVQPRRERDRRGRRGRGERGGHRTGDHRGPSRRSAQVSDLPIISDLLKPGQEILVQIAKEPIAKKGARITSHIALPGRFLVFMPTVSHVGVSRKIASDEERQRLKRILVHERGEASGGFIVRTAAEGASEEELRADLRFLIHLWNEIKQRSDNSKSPALIYHDLSLIERILRDQVSANFSSIWVDSEADYERIVRFLNRFSPSLVRRVKLYTKEVPLFEHFGIQDEISKALRSKVWLKSGGSIVINQTEALVAIDINTGKYVGKTARLEDTIVKTNLDAIPEIVRQIRLRDLGGIIIIDFIDMDERKNRYKVMAALEEALKNDRAPTKVLQFNDFGLVAITRKRVKQSLERTLSVPCLVCQSTGMVKSPITVCNEIFVELRKMRKHFENGDVLLRVNPETVKALKANNARWLTDFEELTGKNILVKSDPALHPEQFDIQG